MADADGLEYLKQRLIAARRNAIVTMAMERNRDRFRTPAC